jgi:glycosyltransferase involved in cell wall biosynthesis
MQPLVSILIPCFNGERWIAQAIESALGQTCTQVEVIVFDDGSTDGSLEVIRQFRSSIRWDAGPNRGGGYARNRLLELARGEWIQYLDADDYLLPTKVATQLQFLAERADVDILVGPTTVEYWSEEEVTRELLSVPEPHDFWAMLARWTLPQTGVPLWRKQAILDVGGWNEDQPCCQEHELYLRLLIKGKVFSYCPSNGAIWRQWSDQTVCKRDIPEVHRRRLQIEDRLEVFLRESRQLDPLRLKAINQARFEIARGAWTYDKRLAKQTMNLVLASDPMFLPDGPAAPPAYATAFKVLGFSAAERVAEALRSLRRPRVRDSATRNLETRR